MPEKLHLLYPKSLAGRLEISNDIRANIEVNDLRKVAIRQIDIEEVRELSSLTLRLEAICSLASNPPLFTTSPTHSPKLSPVPLSPMSLNAEHRMQQQQQQQHVASSSIQGLGTAPPAHLGPTIREEMTDEDLAVIIESLTTRIENAMSTLVSDSFQWSWAVSGAKIRRTQADCSVSQALGWIRIGASSTRKSYEDRLELARTRHGTHEWQVPVVEVRG